MDGGNASWDEYVCVACPPAASLPPSATNALVLRKEGGRLHGHKERVFAMCWSPTHPSLLASVGQSSGFVHNVGDGAGRPVRIAGDELMSVCFSPDSARVFTGSSVGRIDVCDTSSGASCATMEASEDEVYGLRMLPDRATLAAAAGNALQLWDIQKRAIVQGVSFSVSPGGIVFGGPQRNPEAQAYVLCLSVVGPAACCALSDGTIRMVDIRTVAPVGAIDEHARRGRPAFTVSMSKSSPLLASTDDEGAILLWDLRLLGAGPLGEFSGPSRVHGLDFISFDSSEVLVTGAVDGMLRVHETKTAELAVCSSAGPQISPMLCLSVDDNDKAESGQSPRLATAGGSGDFVSDAGISIWRMVMDSR